MPRGFFIAGAFWGSRAAAFLGLTKRLYIFAVFYGTRPSQPRCRALAGCKTDLPILFGPVFFADLQEVNMDSQRKKFERIVAELCVPNERRSGTAENARWFLRSGAIVNRDHPDILLAICLARRLAG